MRQVIPNVSQNIAPPAASQNSLVVSRSSLPVVEVSESLVATTSAAIQSSIPCIDCEVVAPVLVPIGQNTGVNLISTQENNVARIAIPPQTEATLPAGTLVNIESLSISMVPTGSIVSNTVLAITLQDENGAGVPLTGNVELCFTASSLPDFEEGCLAFVNGNGEWECEDSCLQSNNEGQVCGETDHFTNFAILLRSDTIGNNGGCATSNQENFALAIASAGCIAVSVVVVSLIILVSDIYLRIRSHKIHKRLDMLANLSVRVSDGQSVYPQPTVI